MSNMRIFGLSGSGMDIDKIVSDLMRSEKEMRLTDLEQKKQLNTWQQEMYQDVNKDIANFIMDVKKNFDMSTTFDSGLSLDQSSNNFTWVNSASSSDGTIAAATATTEALSGKYELNITQLAENVSKASTGNISVDGTNSNSKLFEQFSGINEGETLTFRIKTNVTESDSTNFPDGYKEFTFDASTDTLEDVINDINNANIGISASYDADLDRVFFNTNSTGKDNYFEVVQDSHNFLSNEDSDAGGNILKLKIGRDTDTSQAIDTYKYLGKDLMFDFGNDATGLTKSSNTFSINGINITAKDTGITNISINTDVDSIVEKVESFVDSYNELISNLNEKINEKVYRDYKPLTEDQKDAMTEKEIEKWEEAAKSGLLKDDPLVTRMLRTVREGLYDKVSGLGDAMDHLTEIGIDTGKYSEKGKLVINESKLRQSIINNPKGVVDVLFKEPSEYTDENDKQAKTGLVPRLFNNMIEGMKDIIDKAGPGEDSELLKDVKSTILINFIKGENLKNGSISIISDDLMDIEARLLTEQDRLNQIEDRYYSQFTAMEQAINRMNQQSSWFMSQLGSM